MTFIATVGAIVMIGARPVFVDSEDGYVIDPSKIEAAITPKTKVILPVHYTGNFADMVTIEEIARENRLKIVEDACHVINGNIHGQSAGSWSEAACISLHPLKNLNVWGDGGVIVTRNKGLAEKLRLLRNHGLINRDEVIMFGRNSRLDSLQAVVGNCLLDEIGWITEKRIEYATRYDHAFRTMSEFVRIPKRRAGVKHVYHLYVIRVKQRDRLLRYLHQHGIEAKIHYPIPIHLQRAAAYLGYKEGNFPECEDDCKNIISLPGHQHLTIEEIDYIIEHIRSFYMGGVTQEAKEVGINKLIRPQT